MASSGTTFLLHPAVAELGPAQPLHLLPFSLGSSSNPYTSTTAPISQYFQPRPAPPNLPSTSQIAAFRGRQLVGQALEVPKGYRGVVLSAAKRPDRGGVEERKAPLTPASSSMSQVDAALDMPSEHAEGSCRPTRRGTGQVALSKPKTRMTRTAVARKRIRLDSDDESESEVAKPTLTRASSKRLRRAETPVKREAEGNLPAITVQSPTPRKKPLRAESTETDLPELTDEEATASEAIHTGSGGSTTTITEDVVPSPALENVVPDFSITTPPIQPEAVSLVEELKQDEDVDGTVRTLRPISTFDSITLWTADAPLAGFRQDELVKAESDVGAAQEDPVTEAVALQTEANGAADDKPKKVDQAGLDLRKGWWRVGGAGEAGDEFVRGMGEWLGLVQMLNEPVYLDGLEDGEDED